MWADWKAKFLTIVSSHAPIITKRVRSGKKVPWITSDQRKGVGDSDFSKQKVQGSSSLALYKRPPNKINGEVKSTKASYYANAFIQSNLDSRKTWQMINEVCERPRTKRELSHQSAVHNVSRKNYFKSVNLEDWNVDSVFPNFNLCLF